DTLRGRPRLVRARSFGWYDAVDADELGCEQVQAPVEVFLVNADTARQGGHQQGRVVAVFGRSVHSDEPGRGDAFVPGEQRQDDASRASSPGPAWRKNGFTKVRC